MGEARFTRDGVFNSHNSHMWSGSNPHVIRPQRHQDSWSVNVWTGMLGNRLIGTYLLPELLTGHSFQHDGAPGHLSSLVRHWLDIEYTGRRIGPRDPVSWPPRSPDLAPFRFLPMGLPKGIGL
ncbi:DUF4817 domain-containing protein [Caerostris extrusa]|uniref:DUF4817 domain-containing protein n=1 Tax=Caerostris extrusa TaxID=172846 RepID=A0AAV4S747_CAEEX|nr:DUF4817 domain-containing protein [Caerostris extrusa]